MNTYVGINYLKHKGNSMKTHIGIDYGSGKSNLNIATGIRYGIIPANATINCGSDYFVDEHDSDCALLIDDENNPDSGLNCTCSVENTGSCVSHHEYLKDGYRLQKIYLADDIFVLDSPYYTRACFCSPCAPGACYLLTDHPEAPKAYCLGHEFFDGGKAPYPVFRISDDAEVLPCIE